jgi:uncharacterized protein YndB with AHSA1/START domain
MRTVLITTGIVIGILALLVAVVALIGMTLPQDHVAARTVRVRQTPEEVFAIISDVENVPAWRADITRVEILPSDNGRMMFREHGSDAVTYRVEASEPPRRRVVRIADTNLPYGGTWTYDVTPIAPVAATATATATAAAARTASFGGEPLPLTQITITERGEVYNPIFRFMSRFVFSHHATIDAYLTALGKKLGEPVTPEPITPETAPTP